MKPQTIKIRPEVFSKRLMRRLFRAPKMTGLLTPAKFKKITSPPSVLVFERYMQSRCVFKWYVNQRAAKPQFNNYLNFHRTKKHPVLTTPPIDLHRITYSEAMISESPKSMKMNVTPLPLFMLNEPNFKTELLPINRYLRSA